MNVKIDIDIIQNILKTFARRDRNQCRIYGILLGNIEGKNTYHIKNCIFGYIYETKDEHQKTGPFKRLNDSITQTIIQNYQSGFPDQTILGGFSTDRDIFHELCLLYDTINDINTTIIPNKNKLLMLLDPYFDKKENLEVGVKFYSWEPDMETKTISYQLIPHDITDNKIPSNIIHSNMGNKEDILLNLNDLDISVIEGEKDFSQIVDKLNSMVVQKGNLKKNSEFHVTNLNYFKARLLNIQKFLVILESYLENKLENLDQEVLNKIEILVNELLDSFNDEEIYDAIVKEYKQNQVVQTLTNLLKLQVNITEKINESILNQ